MTKASRIIYIRKMWSFCVFWQLIKAVVTPIAPTVLDRVRNRESNVPGIFSVCLLGHVNKETEGIDMIALLKGLFVMQLLLFPSKIVFKKLYLKLLYFTLLSLWLWSQFVANIYWFMANCWPWAGGRQKKWRKCMCFEKHVTQLRIEKKQIKMVVLN
jgi:hypothetical protein